MSRPERDSAAAVLRPILTVAGGVIMGDAAGLATGAYPAVPWGLGLLLLTGLLSLASGLRRPGSRLPLLLAAGLALGFAAGAAHAANHTRLCRMAPEGTTVRAVVRVLGGWRTTRWGASAPVRIASAAIGGRTAGLPRLARLEIRGGRSVAGLPQPGSTVEGLLRIHHTPDAASTITLVAKSPRLLRVTGPSRGLPAIREHLVTRVLEAAGTSADRIRSAELAAALALGRKDLLPEGRIAAWRDSGLAHVLAVSGLHVGILAGLVWLFGTAAGFAPAPRRAAVLLLVPAYALLAGASPSAIRAAIMIDTYLLARFLGRHVIPLGAVALAVTAMLLAEPALLLRPGFQLTVLVTAALLRWVPPLAERLPLPRKLAAAVAVPVVAQLAALPLVAWWFGRIVPGGVLTNLAGLALLPVLIVSALASVILAAVWPPAAVPTLALTGLASHLLLAAGGPARAHLLTLPPIPPAAAAAGGVLALLAILPGRAGRRALVLGTVTILAGLPFLLTPRPTPDPGVTLLPVNDGAAVLIRASGGSILLDGGRRAREADRLLREAGISRLAAVIASHADEDHIGGLAAVLRGRPAGYLVLPRWMLSCPEAVPLLRAARSRGSVVVPLARGVGAAFGRTALETLWPPALDPPERENDRSLVLRVTLAGASVLLPGDTTSRVESRYTCPARTAGLLVVPHHGSRSSCSTTLLERTRPRVALVPAGPGTPYPHPSPRTLRRLRRAGVPYLVSRWTPWCGASLDSRGRWRLVP